MPTESLIIGVDLSPIKAIPRVITFQSDITTDKCRATIRQHLKTWKVDTVLHDGAPNVGVAWVQDAFSQAELVLQSLKLATEFLVPGGSFVTKVFRSKDYNPLLWVFKQLFNTVEATKPPSSRNVSAEIFVVCLGFKAPKHIDPKFLDPKHVFAELQDPTPNNEAKVFNPEKKKRKREGYEEDNYTQHKEIPVTEFINTTDPIAILGSYNKLSFQQSPSGDLALSTLERLPETTEEVKSCCEDLKVLGKKEFRTLLRWRLKVREQFGLVVKKGPAKPEEAEEVAEVAPMDEELALQEELHRLRDQESTLKKRERRKENERKRKDIVRMQMNMITPTEIGMEQDGPIGEGSVFSLKPIQREGATRTISSGTMITAESDDEEEDGYSTVDDETDEEEDRLERQLDSMYEQYQESREDRDTKLRAKKARKALETDEWEGFSDNSGSDDESDDEEDNQSHPSLPKGTQENGLSNKAALFFDQDIFHDLGALDGEEDEDGASSAGSNEGNSGDTKDATPNDPKEPQNSKSFEGDYETDDEDQQEISNNPQGKDEQQDPRSKDGKLGKLPKYILSKPTQSSKVLTQIPQTSTLSQKKPWLSPNN